MLVPQDYQYDVFITKKMVKRAQFGYITTTRPKYIKVSFEISFIHIGLVDTSSTYISIRWDICYG